MASPDIILGPPFDTPPLRPEQTGSIEELTGLVRMTRLSPRQQNIVWRWIKKNDEDLAKVLSSHELQKTKLVMKAEAYLPRDLVDRILGEHDA